MKNLGDVLKRYHKVAEAIKKMEAEKEGLKTQVLKFVPDGTVDAGEYTAVVSRYDEIRLASPNPKLSVADVLVKKFGAKAMKPYLKPNEVCKLTVRRKAEDKKPKVVKTVKTVTFENAPATPAVHA